MNGPAENASEHVQPLLNATARVSVPQAMAGVHGAQAYVGGDIVAAFGILVLVFQSSWSDTLLGTSSHDGVVSWLPLFLFAMLFGLSMDYHVFVVSRIREAVQRGMDTRSAVEYGIIRSAGVVETPAFRRDTPVRTRELASRR